MHWTRYKVGGNLGRAPIHVLELMAVQLGLEMAKVVAPEATHVLVAEGNTAAEHIMAGTNARDRLGGIVLRDMERGHGARVTLRVTRLLTKAMPADAPSRNRLACMLNFAREWGSPMLVYREVGAEVSETEKRVRGALAEQREKTVLCICAGMSAAADVVGLRVVGLVEVDPAAVEVAKARTRAPGLGSLQDFVEGEEEAPEADVYLFTPPCQPFTDCDGRRGRGEYDDRDLTPLVVRCIRRYRPRRFVLENVPQIRNYAAYRLLAKDVPALGYRVEEMVMRGRGTNRTRWFMMGVRADVDRRTTTRPEPLGSVAVRENMYEEEWGDPALREGIPPMSEWEESGVVQQADWGGLRLIAVKNPEHSEGMKGYAMYRDDGIAVSITTGRHGRSPGYNTGVYYSERRRAARRLSLRECCAVMGIASGILMEMVDQGKITPEQGMAMVGESMDVPMLRAALDMVWSMGIEG